MVKQFADNRTIDLFDGTVRQPRKVIEATCSCGCKCPCHARRLDALEKGKSPPPSCACCSHA